MLYPFSLFSVPAQPLEIVVCTLFLFSHLLFTPPPLQLLPNTTFPWQVLCCSYLRLHDQASHSVAENNNSSLIKSGLWVDSEGIVASAPVHVSGAAWSWELESSGGSLIHMPGSRCWEDGLSQNTMASKGKHLEGERQTDRKTDWLSQTRLKHFMTELWKTTHEGSILVFLSQELPVRLPYSTNLSINGA